MEVIMKIRQINTFINKALALSLTVAATAGLTGCGTASVRSKELSAAAAAPADGEEDGEESFENTEYGGVKSYLEYAGIEAQQDAADARVIKIAYGYSGYNVVNLSRKSANYKFTRMKKPFVIP